jgi:hypothetical protein
MLSIEVDIPKPSQYVPNLKVDEIALATNQAYRSKTRNGVGYPLNMDTLLDLLEVSTVWEDIEEP